jgi:hypothetical protein
MDEAIVLATRTGAEPDKRRLIMAKFSDAFESIMSLLLLAGLPLAAFGLAVAG